ncbi:MAG: polyisoprenyl-phosphate glycosyltransferase [Verrucomicrobiota bacterium]|jgi:dolichol-phosphate mannosyltransferase
MLVSVIIPCFNEEKVLQSTYSEISGVMRSCKQLDYELIFINDGSKDNTYAILKDLAAKDNCVRVIAFSRNFGHQPAVSAGIKYCQGDLAVIIDADLQDPPQVIPEMIKALQDANANCVYGVRKKREGETVFKLITAKLFYLFLNSLSEVPLPINTGDFRLIDRKIINSFNALGENNKYIRGLMSWVGFKQIPFYYERQPRFAGETKYTLKSMIRFASIAIFYFSKKPLKLATMFGFGSVGLGFLGAIFIVASKFLNNPHLSIGWPSVMVTVIFFGGVQLLTIGILGQYIGSLFDEIKKRPEFIVNELTNLNEPPRVTELLVEADRS